MQCSELQRYTSQSVLPEQIAENSSVFDMIQPLRCKQLGFCTAGPLDQALLQPPGEPTKRGSELV